MKIIFAGDSWALKGFTPENYDKGNNDPLPGDLRLADYWPWKYHLCLCPGRGNLAVLDKLVGMNLSSDIPVVWIYTEPGRDYGIITQKNEFGWMESEDIFTIRQDLDREILTRIRSTLKNPVGLIGGLSDINVALAESLGFDVLHDSWQRWIAEKLESQWFQFGWGASDIGWRTVYNGIKPSRAATFAWDEQIKEWCWWEQQGYFCHEHPTIRANEEFADYLKSHVEKWLTDHGK